MSELPEYVVIGPYTFAIERDDRLLDETDAYARVGYDPERITIHSQRTATRQAVGLLHEVLHACIELAGQQMGETEEQVITTLSPILLDALRRNPALVVFLVDAA